MEDTATQEPKKKHILLWSVSSVATVILGIKILIGWSPDMLNESSALYLMAKVLINPYFYTVICGLWLLTAFYLYFQGKYEIFRQSVSWMGYCFSFFWGLETGVFKMIVIYFINAFSF
ncbi:hypothetical protein HP548_12240 [Paenibacillus taichungensis]|uniref:Uncharacterized protein n=1 Tax=Paenibacillus taichungensis TaxID=484184 RepID=A0ABX2MLB3_9BACL|nr:hypothetical protein [Paenibacillus taichungensis]NUU54846.1 hypothetical protein [Paenibacillus taichungensis]